MLVGLPASGKTTFCRKLMENFPGVFDVVSVDNYIDAKAAEHNISYDEAHRLFCGECVKRSKEDNFLFATYKKDYIIDKQNISFRHKKLVDNADNYVNIAVVFSTPPLSEWKKRLKSRPGKTVPDYVLKENEASFLYPNRDEGFDKIFQAKNEHKIFSFIKECLASRSPSQGDNT